MFQSATLFNQSLIYWCVRRIATLPANFATNSSLSPALYPRWGTCPAPAAPSVPLTPEALPAASPSGTPAATAPSLPPGPPCTSQLPPYAINATCVNGSWIFTTAACAFFGNCPGTTPSSTSPPTGSSIITIPPGTVITLTGSLNATGVTLVIPIRGGSSGQIVFQDCASLSGGLIVTFTQGGDFPAPGSSAEVLVADQGNCSQLQLNQTVTIQGADTGCSKLIGKAQQTQRGEAKSISILFSVDSSGCLAPGSAPSVDSILSGVSAGPIVGGVIGAIAAVAIIVALTLFLIKRRSAQIARQALRNKMGGL